jgi:xylulokinase
MILAVDVGTSTVKGALFSDSGVLAGRAELPVDTRAPDDADMREIPAELWVSALKGIASQLLAGRTDLDAIAISGNGPTLVPVDSAGRPLHSALTWLDGRAVAEAEEVSAAVGFRVDPSFNIPKALWFKNHRPDIYEATDAFMSCPEFLCRVLTGESVTVVPAGYEKHYGEASTLAALGLDSSKFPPFAAPGVLVGETTAAGSNAAGVPRGAKVIAVGPDYLAALIGTATTKPGRACDRAGSSEGINLCASKGTDDRRLISVPHIVPPYANVSGMISSTGAAVDWFRRSSGLGDAGYEAFFEEVARARPGSGGLLFLPYLAGERSPIWDLAARGAFVGLALAHGRAEMARAVVESTAFAMRDVIEVMEESGAAVCELRATGGPSRSAPWNQIKADVTGRPIAPCAFGEAELLGDFCFALAATGRCADPAEAAERLVVFERVHEPDPANKALYDDLFLAYREAYGALKGVFKRLAAATTRERSAGR